jgi:subtilisin family serine protease
VRVIVQLAEPVGAQPALAQMHSQAMTVFRHAGVENAHLLSPRLPFVVAELTRDQLTTLYPDPHFRRWSEDRIAHATSAENGALVQAPQLWALGGRGQGQAVAILDTGVDATHPFLAGRVVDEACFSTTSALEGSSSVCPNGQAQQTGVGAARPCAASGCEHGTHVAGIAAGRGTDFSGMAPDASIVAVQVFSAFSNPAQCGGQPSCVASYTSDQIRALDYVLQIAAQRHVASVNMSLGGGRSTTFCDDELTKPVIDQLRAAGVATVIAAGNDGDRTAVSFPGCISTAVTIAASTMQDELAPFSNCGPQVDLIAPGVSINSSIPGGGFAVYSGTSMATPHVTGAFAAIRSARPSANVDQIEAALKSSGLNVAGRPRIRLADALTALGGPTTPPPAAIAQAPSAQTSRAAASAPAAASPPETSPPATSPAQTAPDPLSPTETPKGLMMQLNDVSGLAALAELPDNRPARFIVATRKPGPGLTAAQALDHAERAARQAGASRIERLGGQLMLLVEATPAQIHALAHSGAIASVQVDRSAPPQH